MAKPEKFVVLKVIKSALEFIRLEGELESRAPLSKLLAKLDGRSINISMIALLPCARHPTSVK